MKRTEAHLSFARQSGLRHCQSEINNTVQVPRAVAIYRDKKKIAQRADVTQKETERRGTARRAASERARAQNRRSLYRARTKDVKHTRVTRGPTERK